MPCFRPLTGYRAAARNPSGKRSIVFNKRDAFPPDHPQFEQIDLPCGQCRFCRLEHSRQMAIRCMHEASLHSENSFLTLTYSSENLPSNGSLDYHAPTKFMERLRDLHYPKKIRSYGCGEYGENLNHPHYHILLFGHDFADKRLWKRSRENPLYRSAELERLWPYGFSTCGEVTFDSAAYVARYVTKKISGGSAAKHYGGRLPEKPLAVSRRPGIGRLWLDKHASFMRVHDFAIINGKKVRPPKYYDRIFDAVDPDACRKIKERRRQGGEKASAQLDAEDAKAIHLRKNNSLYPKRRLWVLEDVLELKFTQLKRNFENGIS